jgi:hypothetical protein
VGDNQRRPSFAHLTDHIPWRHSVTERFHMLMTQHYFCSSS